MTFAPYAMNESDLWTETVEDWDPADLDPEVAEEVEPEYGVLTDAEEDYAGQIVLALFRERRENTPFHAVEVKAPLLREALAHAVERPLLLSEIQQAARWAGLMFWSHRAQGGSEVFTFVEVE